jgi:HEAT repeat protein
MGSRRSVVWLAAFGALGVCAVATWRPPAEDAEVEQESVREDVSASALAPRVMRAPACRAKESSLDAARLSRLITQLERSSSVYARCRQLELIAHMRGVGEAVVALVARYAEPPRPEHLRLCAVGALGDLHEPSAIPRLQALVSSSDTRLLNAVVRAIANHEEPAAHAALLAFARTGRSELQVEAGVALAELADPAAPELLAGLITSVTRTSARRLIIALGTTHDPHALPVLEGFLNDATKEHNSVIKALGELGLPGGTRLLLDQLAREPHRAEQILEALAASSDPGAREALIAAAEGGDPSCDANRALNALLELEGDDTRALMLRSLHDVEPERQSIAAEYFSRHGDAAAVPGLVALVNAEGRPFAAAALDALAAIGGDAALAAVAAEARNRTPMQSAALRALAQMPGGEDTARDIAIELTQRGGDGRAEAAALLASDDSPEAHAALLSAAQRDDYAALQAIDALAESGDDESRQLMVRLSRAEGAVTRAHALSRLVEADAPEALDSVRMAVGARDPTLRQSAVDMLSTIGGAEAERVAMDVSRSDDAELAGAAVQELGAFNTEAANDALAQLAQGASQSTAGPALQALADNDPERAAGLFQQLPPSSDPAVLRAALSLNDRLPKTALEGVLERALATKDEAVESELDDLLSARDERAALRDPLATLAQKSGAPEQIRERARALLVTLNTMRE